MRIVSITLLEGFGPDRLGLELDIPNGEFPFDGNAVAHLEVARFEGRQYCRKYFPNIPVEIVGREAKTRE